MHVAMGLAATTVTVCTTTSWASLHVNREAVARGPGMSQALKTKVAVHVGPTGGAGACSITVVAAVSSRSHMQQRMKPILPLVCHGN